MYGTQKRVAGGEWVQWTVSGDRDGFESLVKMAGGLEDKLMVLHGASHLSMDTPKGKVEFRLFDDEEGAAPE